MGCFFLKGTPVEPKSVAEVSSYDTEVSWQVWVKTDSLVPIQPRKKSVNFAPGSQTVEISNLIGLVFRKGTLVEPKTVAGVLSDDTEKSWEVWGKTDSWFPIQLRKKSNFLEKARRPKFQISSIGFISR